MNFDEVVCRTFANLRPGWQGQIAHIFVDGREHVRVEVKVNRCLVWRHFKKPRNILGIFVGDKVRSNDARERRARRPSRQCNACAEFTETIVAHVMRRRRVSVRKIQLFVPLGQTPFRFAQISRAAERIRRGVEWKLFKVYHPRRDGVIRAILPATCKLIQLGDVLQVAYRSHAPSRREMSRARLDGLPLLQARRHHFDFSTRSDLTIACVRRIMHSRQLYERHAHRIAAQRGQAHAVDAQIPVRQVLFVRVRQRSTQLKRRQRRLRRVVRERIPPRPQTRSECVLIKRLHRAHDAITDDHRARRRDVWMRRSKRVRARPSPRVHRRERPLQRRPHRLTKRIRIAAHALDFDAERARDLASTSRLRRRRASRRDSQPRASRVLQHPLARVVVRESRDDALGRASRDDFRRAHRPRRRPRRRRARVRVTAAPATSAPPTARTRTARRSNTAAPPARSRTRASVGRRPRARSRRRRASPAAL